MGDDALTVVLRQCELKSQPASRLPLPRQTAAASIDACVISSLNRANLLAGQFRRCSERDRHADEDPGPGERRHRPDIGRDAITRISAR